MRKTGIILSSLAALAMCPGWAQAAGTQSPAASADTADLPVRRVTLYTSGVGYFERTGSVDGDASETLLFPVGQVNDVLKSLILLDYGGGGIQPVTYGARDPLDKQLQAFSIDLSDSPSMAVLLSRIRGATVTVTPLTTPALTGTVMGVETRTVTLPNNGGTTQEQFLNLLSDDGLHAVKLSDVGGVKIADPKLDAELRAALGTIAEGRDTSKRPVRLAFHGQGKRDVLVGYLTEAPLWQTTYRLVLGEKPLLQGWALVQNTSQDDWSGVDLSLVSGRPISFTQDLYTPLYVTRPDIKPQLMTSTGPVTYDSNLNDQRTVVKYVKVPAPLPPVATVPPTPGGYPGAPALVSAESGTDANGAQFNVNLADKEPQSTYTSNMFVSGHMQLQAASRAMGTQGALMGESLFSYHIKTPVSVPRQQSAMIPFVSAGITAEPVSIFNASVNETHPLTGTRIVNSTPFHLMGGPITVFDQSASANGYVGDALIDDTEPGQKRLISYAVDTAVDAVAEDNGEDNGQIESIKIAKGVITTSDRQRASTKYTFKNHAQKARTIVVESPYPGDGWDLLTPKKADEHTRDVDRFDVPVAAGASKSFVVTREMTQDESQGILDCDLPTLTQYTTNGKISPDVKAALQEIVRRRQAVWHIDKEIANRKANADQISQGQQRIRDNMKALDHASTLYKRYVGELDAQETKLQSLQDQIVQLQSDRDKAQTDLASYAGSLTAK